uniref:Uncharacterized protein n=1 Tax=Setaria italica TaxID=4555 RepID=K3Y3H1_SETIT
MGSSSSRSCGSGSTHHSDDYTPSPMREEDMPQEEHYGSQAMQVEGQPLDLHGDREIQAYALIKDRVFVHTQAFNSELLESIGMDVNFANVWHTIGWNDFMPISEEVDFDKAVRDFNCQSFWTSISDQVVVGKFAPRCTDIHNPTLRLMHKWLALLLFPREDLYKCRELTLPLAPQKEARRSNVSGRVTRTRSRSKATTSQYQPPQPQHIMQASPRGSSRLTHTTQFNTINTTHDNLQAYFRSQGYNPHPGQQAKNKLGGGHLQET